MSGAAQSTDDTMIGVGGSEGASALKQMAAERLAAHRSKRAALQAREAAMEAQVQVRREDTRRGVSQVRDAVAARYQQRLSYQEYLASESARVRAEAEAEARRVEDEARPDIEAEARRAKVLAEAQAWAAEAGESRQPVWPSKPRSVARGESATAEMRNTGPVMDAGRGGLRVQMYEELGAAAVRPVMPGTGTDGRSAALDPMMHADIVGELEDLENEIAFRHSDGFENHTLEMTGIPGNLIEFPRQLVASRKARPRLAEGPLRDEAEAEPQLRIFEVEPEQISQEPAVVDAEASVPEWHGMELDAAVELPVESPSQVQFAMRPLTASPARRVMAGMVDFCLVGLGFTAFATEATVLGHGLRGVAAGCMGATAAVVLLTLYVMYQMLFFTLAEATPGMLYARIGLCTFGDNNPKRKAMRRRVLATLLAACPVGLGVLWMWMDDDRLGWQDRMSRVYPRSY